MTSFWGFRAIAIVIVGLAIHAMLPFAARAADAPVIQEGNIAVTGFSGTKFPAEGIPSGIDPLDETFIDPNGASLRIFDVSIAAEPPKGQLVYTPPPFEVTAKYIGQVFGLALDDGKRGDSTERIPNLYATATSFYGLQIVVPDKDDDGVPERLKKGEPGAEFMTGQWGGEEGAGPGSIWKIDGKTGEAALFANVELDGTQNSGPGLGNIAFDPINRQLFVSDLQTGMIHRFDLEGHDLGHFDHGVNGRPKKDLPPLADDPAKRMDITSPSFDTEKPESWGYAARERLVYGLAVHGRRLFYAVMGPDSPQIWSIGIARDGGFADDPRWELDAEAETDHPVTDLVFDRQARLYLAQRGFVQNPYDYSVFAVPAMSEVLRYRKEDPDNPETPSVWAEEPEEYAIGFPEGHRMTDGGIDLGYGYDETGYVARKTCDGYLGTTGDNLRDNPELAEKLAEGGPFHVHGFQLNDRSLVRPKNVPPFKSYFADYDGTFDDPEVRGHIGDIEIWHPCAGRVGWGEYIPYRGEYPYPLPPGIPLPPGERPRPECVELEWVDYFCTPGGIDAFLSLTDKAGIGADSIKAQSLYPGISVSPPIQSRADPADPFYLEILGALPGDRADINICFYNSAGVFAGQPFPCCKARIPLTLPPDICAP
jgi:hypothetical protein